MRSARDRHLTRFDTDLRVPTHSAGCLPADIGDLPTFGAEVASEYSDVKGCGDAGMRFSLSVILRNQVGWLSIGVFLIKRESPRLCRGGSRTLRIPGVYLPLLLLLHRSRLFNNHASVTVAFHRLR
jgi:hypothetical protein